jgi:hypothetical protein
VTGTTEEPLRYEAMTGLSIEQLTELMARVHAVRGGELISRGRPYALGRSLRLKQEEGMPSREFWCSLE